MIGSACLNPEPSERPPEIAGSAAELPVIGVIECTLGNWVGKARREREQGSSLTADEPAELAGLRGEHAQLRTERDQLKTITGFWVKESTP